MNRYARAFDVAKNGFVKNMRFSNWKTDTQFFDYIKLWVMRR